MTFLGVHDRRYSGMTVHERLSEAGLHDQFDVAVKMGNKTRLIALLEEVELGDQAEQIADAALARAPRLYPANS